MKKKHKNKLNSFDVVVGLFEGILENSNTVIYVKDKKGRYVLSNRYYEKLLGLKRKEIIGKTDRDIYPPEMANTLEKYDRKVLKKKVPIEIEETTPISDKAYTFISYKFPLSTNKGNIGYVCTISTNITDKKSDELVLELVFYHQRLYGTILELSLDDTLTLEKYLEICLDTILSSIRSSHKKCCIIINNDNKIVKVSRGKKKRDCGELCYCMNKFHLKGIQEVDCVEAGHISNYTTSHKHLYVPLMVSDKTIGILSVTTKESLGNASVRFLKSISEILGRIILNKLKDKEIINARDEALRGSQEKSEFLSMISHELRTPLSSIVGFAHLLEQEENHKLSYRGQEYVKEILKSTDHLASIIGDVLDFGKIERGDINMSIEKIPLHEIVSEAIKMTSNLANKKSISIYNNVMDIDILSDRLMLRQSLINYISNAIKYNKEKGKVYIRSYDHNAWHRIEVEDSGIGIPEPNLNLVFTPFERLQHRNSSIEGFGIGLTATKKMVEKMGGNVGVSSNLGKGSTFWIDLKKYDKEKFKISGSKILYIEDNPVNRKLIIRLLEKIDGIVAIEASSGTEGIDIIRNYDIDLILVDLNLGDMSGYDVLSSLKQMENKNHIPIMALTADANKESMHKGIKAGFSEYITKPVGFDKLKRLIQTHLEIS